MVDFSYRNNYIPMVMEKGQVWLNSPPTDPRKRAQTTGIASLDEPLATMFVFYWTVIDGSCPGLSVMFTNYFGTIILSLMLGTLESLRKGNRTSGCPTLWGMLGIMVTLAVSIPWYLTVHLLISPTASQPTIDNLSVPVHELKALIVNLIFGLMLPCLLVALPERITWNLFTRQSAIALWQLWPFWSTAVHYIAKIFISTKEDDANPRARWERTRATFRAVYGLTFAVAAITHLATWAISLSIAFGFRNSMDADIVADVHPWNVFVNTKPWSSIQTDSVGQGTLWLIQWDQLIAAGAMWWWALDLYRSAHATQGRRIDWHSFAVKTLAFCFVSGFTGATVELLWEREEMILEAGQVTVKRK
ncbi:hypothetical protein N7517_008836 [Penicillium concentricum]|uniref:Uncharacterized protein n=1 Tax=Penicillium concentricum TaxID=293559 RepID=A0A9W9V493_9EURO|nr:uncharacterized protein N7517_008836 [Penicillium concentricum]KAJ5365950.1 hypothetical protein N7517_008836 [Penicillium concentricum]